MAKLTEEQAKAQLLKIEAAVNGLKAANIEIPEALQAEYDKLMKTLTGSASSQTAKILNDSIAARINDYTNEKNTPLREAIIAAVGTKCKLQIEVITAEDGTKTIKFDSAGSTGGGTGSTKNAGSERSEQKFNHFKVELTAQPVNAKGEAIEYKETSYEGNSATGAVAYMLNGGNNPANLGAEFGKGNAMTRVLLGNNQDSKGGFAAHPEFSKFFKITAEKRDVVKAEPAVTTEPATTDAATV